VDWSRTRAYALGFSGIYLNLRGREKPGLVEPGPEAERLKREIIQKLEGLTDPKTGARVVRKVHLREDAYHGPEVAKSPDLIVGFDLYYGCSDFSALGGVSKELFQDTEDAWSGSHLMDPSVVPGILLVNGRIRIDDPWLGDLAASILADFGIEPEEMQGRKIWEAR
jgi:predicted AlkP superfamily phosphohydrolase/phosphomutase